MLARGTPALLGARRGSSGAAQRAYTLNDAPTRPTLWVDAQDAATFTLDGTNRVVSWASKGSAAAAFAPPASGQAPLYDGTAIVGTRAGLRFDPARTDRLDTGFNGPAPPATVVYVWQEAATGQTQYSAVVDHRTGGGANGGRVTLFNTYNGNSTVIGIVPNDTPAQYIFLTNAPGQMNVLVVEYNGASSRYYFNGVEVAAPNMASVLSGAGVAIGGRAGDIKTNFCGSFGELAAFPAIFAGDAWSRITQGTMWKWGQQANIAAGAGYKNAPPTVSP